MHLHAAYVQWNHTFKFNFKKYSQLKESYDIMSHVKVKRPHVPLVLETNEHLNSILTGYTLNNT